MKIDILGSRNLTIIHDTLAFVKERCGSAPGVDEIPVDDKNFALLRRVRVWVVSSWKAQACAVLRLLAPRCLEDLIHLLSLYRPGPWESGMVETFVARHHGQAETTYVHPRLVRILADTHGVILYQEQVMRIACEVGGYTPGEADGFRRDLTRRVQPDFHRCKFVRGARAKGLTLLEAEAIFAHLCRFAGYSFNKAHSAAYA